MTGKVAASDDPDNTGLYGGIVLGLAAIAALVGGSALLLMGASPSPLVSVALLSILAAGVYSYVGPFWAIPNEFLTGYAAAAGIGLINSVGNLGGFAGPYAIGVITGWTGSMYGGLALAGVPLLAAAGMLVLLPSDSRPGTAPGTSSSTTVLWANAPTRPIHPATVFDAATSA